MPRSSPDGQGGAGVWRRDCARMLSGSCAIDGTAVRVAATASASGARRPVRFMVFTSRGKSYKVSFMAQYNRQIVRRHLDDFCQRQPLRSALRNDVLDVAHAPVGIARAQVAIECIVAGRGMAPAAPVRSEERR